MSRATTSKQNKPPIFYSAWLFTPLPPICRSALGSSSQSKIFTVCNKYPPTAAPNVIKVSARQRHKRFFHFSSQAPMQTAAFFPLLLTICIFHFFQIWGRIRSLCLFVLSTPVFLLTLCRFHIGEEGNKKKKSSTPVPKSLRTSSDSSFPPHSRSFLFVCPPASLRPPLDTWSSTHHTSQIILLWLQSAGL